MRFQYASFCIFTYAHATKGHTQHDTMRVGAQHCTYNGQGWHLKKIKWEKKTKPIEMREKKNTNIVAY